MNTLNGSVDINKILRKLPSVDRLLKNPELVELLKEFPRDIVVNSIREVLAEKRNFLIKTGSMNLDLEESDIVEKVKDRIKLKMSWTLKRVVNATGVIIHTNLGRSLIPKISLDRIFSIGSFYNNLEYNLDAGRRGSRYVHAERLLKELTGAEAALVVNNNAAAVFLVLNTIAKGKEVIVSRGELVEIGGSFRIPDVMASSGAILKEVGCTNKTHSHDYEHAITDNTAAILKVHKSNYKIVGFTKEVSSSELVQLSRKYGLYCVEDMGSGCFIDLSPFGIVDEPTVKQELKAGVDVITFSGDKLLGGPQAGIILGRKEIIERCKKNPMTRAFRVCKLTLSALEAVLRLYLDEKQAIEHIPTLRMICASLPELERKANNLAKRLQEVDTQNFVKISVEDSIARIGGGASPTAELPSKAVTLLGERISASKIERFFRTYDTPIIVRVENDKVFMDVRTMVDGDEMNIIKAFQEFTKQSLL